MNSWQPHIDLVRLIEALGQEIAATTDEEVRQTCTEYGLSIRAAAGEVRRLLAPMIDDPTEPGAGLPPAPLVRGLEQRQRH